MPRFATPTPRTRPNPSTPTPRRPKFTPGGDRRLPEHCLAGPSQSARGRTRTPRPACLVPLQTRGGGVSKTPQGFGGHRPGDSRSRALSLLGATSELFRRDGTHRRETAAPRVSLPQGKLRTPRGATLPSVRHSRGAHTRPKARAGKTPASAPIPHSTKMSGRVTGQPPPGPTPGTGRTRCLSAQERGRRAELAGEDTAPTRTHRQLGRHGGEARDK